MLLQGTDQQSQSAGDLASEAGETGERISMSAWERNLVGYRRPGGKHRGCSNHVKYGFGAKCCVCCVGIARSIRVKSSPEVPDGMLQPALRGSNDAMCF